MARLATLSEAGLAAAILARAFVRDPVLGALVGEGQTARVARYFELESRLAIAGAGEVWVEEDGAGAAIWRRPHGWPDGAWTQLRMLPAYLRVFPRRFLVASRAVNALAAAHPREPHWYLFAVGVVPEATGRGRGSRLLEPVLARCDASATSAYLEATSPDNARLYARLGFSACEELEILPGVRVWPMWREPQSA